MLPPAGRPAAVASKAPSVASLGERKLALPRMVSEALVIPGPTYLLTA
jgi:hypothetical protein